MLRKGYLTMADWSSKLITARKLQRLKVRYLVVSIPGLLTNAALNTKATNIQNKIPHITSLANKATLNTKAIERGSKMPNLTKMATKAALSTKSTYTDFLKLD